MLLLVSLIIGVCHAQTWPPAPADASAPPPAATCTALHLSDRTLNPWGIPLPEAQACDALAEAAWRSVSHFQGELPLGAVEPFHSAPVGVHGSAAQIQPAAEIQPVPRSGGAVGLAGTGGAPRLIAGISINPAALAAQSAQEYAHASRQWDVSVQIPVALSEQVSTLDAVALRWRRSLRSREAAEQALALASPAYAQRNVPAPVVISEMATLLYRAADKAGCLTALHTGSAENITAGCGAPLPALRSIMMVDRAELAVLEDERPSIDAEKVGIELGLALGDPSFTDRRGVYVSAEAGRSWPAGRCQLRARGGPQLATVSGGSGGALLGAVAGDLLLSERGDPTVLSAGLDARLHRGEVLSPSHLLLQLALQTPISERARFGMGLSVPVAGEEAAPLFALTVDWRNLGS